MSVHLLNPEPETQTITRFTISLVNADGLAVHRWTQAKGLKYNPATDAISFIDEDGKSTVIFNPGRVIVKEEN